MDRTRGTWSKGSGLWRWWEASRSRERSFTFQQSPDSCKHDWCDDDDDVSVRAIRPFDCGVSCRPIARMGNVSTHDEEAGSKFKVRGYFRLQIKLLLTSNGNRPNPPPRDDHPSTRLLMHLASPNTCRRRSSILPKSSQLRDPQP
ncbi:hypothetical protein GW17_00044299 [Ensete ventricosum]|nr:hypothetical protein GW17_00044299 [Ensete ventricosum]